MSSENPSKNIQYFDTLRVIATLAVILIHVATPVVNMNFGRNTGFWIIGVVLDNLVRFAVPLFLVLSGATLLTKQFTLIDFYKKRMSRVLIPLLFWLPAYWLFRWFMLREWERPLGFDAIVRWGTDLFVREGVSVHLWFVYMILLLYLFMPFISKILKSASRKSIVVFLVLWLALNHLQLFGVFNTGSFSLLFQKLYGYMLYIGYLVLGYYLQTLKSNCKLPMVSAFTLYLSTVVFASLVTYYLSVPSGKQTLTAMNTFTLNTFLQVIAVYFLLKNIEFKNKYLVLFIQMMSNYSFGIYLVHIMVISLFYRIGIFWTMTHPLISVPLVVILTLITSFIVIFLLRKIPFMARFAG